MSKELLTIKPIVLRIYNNYSYLLSLKLVNCFNDSLNLFFF